MSTTQLSKDSERALRLLNKHRQLIEADIASIKSDFESETVDPELMSEIIDEVLRAIKVFRDDEQKNFDEDNPELFCFGLKLFKTASELKLKVKKLINNSNTQVTNTKNSDLVKLPDITLPSFSGDYREWFSFKDAFNSMIGDNTKLSNLEKFQYLKSSLKGQAAKTIQSLELTEANYSNALDLLRENFENKRIIVNSHIHELFNLPHIKKEGINEYREFISTISQNVHALEALKRPISSEDWLVNLIIMRCPESIRLQWENSLSNSEMPTVKELTAFLSKRLQSLKSIYSEGSSNVDHFKNNVTTNSNNTLSCYVCSQAHQLFNCNQFRALEVSKRSDLVRSKKLCRNCLKLGHNAIDCKSSKRCKTCNKPHNTLLHFNNQTYSNPTASGSNSLHVQNLENGTILLATSLIEVRQGNIKHTLRALLDPGSQLNLISNNAIKKLKLKTVKTNTGFSVAGGNKMSVQTYVNIDIASQISNFSASICCFSINHITHKLPSERVNVSKINIPTHIQLADPQFFEPSDVDLLIGVELYNRLLKSEHIIIDEGNLRIQNTQLGWVISGRVPESRPQRDLSCHSVTLTELNSNIKRFWELENIEPKEDLKSKEEIDCQNHFNNSVERDLDGRFIVALPWKTDTSNLGNSYGMAKKRLFNLEYKLKRTPDLSKQYVQFMREYIQLGHMTRVPFSDNGYFLPHHAVYKKSSLTTKLRVVFDASAKSTTKTSLNDLLLTGPTLQENLFDILIRFRIHEYVVTADVQMMFRQIMVRESDRKYQRILWRESPDMPIQVYQLNTVTYGTCCASFLAVQCLQNLAKEAPDNITSKTILRDFYMDDVLTGASTIKEARQLRDALNATLANGGFLLRKWASNSHDIVNDLNNSEISNHTLILSPNEQIKALGVQWNPIKDSIEYKSFCFNSTAITKRTILSEISKCFDPLGLLGPVIIKAKLILQDIWKQGLKWDERVPQNILESWLLLRNELSTMQPISTNRKVKTSPNASIEIHAFGDASLDAYGSAVYLKSINSNGSTACQLLCAKSRVAPLKTVTLPRLELCAAILTANLVDRVKSALHNTNIKCFYYSDSTIVLSWINSEPFKFKQFVAHRIGEIQRLSVISDWHHIRSEHNPADIISRGSLPSALINNNLWWYGPDFLKQSPAHQTFIPTFNEHAEFRILTVTKTNSKPLIPWLNKYSCYIRLLRVTAWINRFIHNKFLHPNEKITGELNTVELNKAETLIIKASQLIAFSKEINQIKTNQSVDNIMQLNPFIDQSGIIRVGGRLRYAKLLYDSKFPVILPKNCTVTKLIVRHYHYKNLHIGPQGTLAAIRTKFWPISGKNTVKKIIRECIICFKNNPRSSEPIMGNLPECRSEQLRPFIKTGIDYGGPFLIKESVRKTAKLVKKYIALFVCMSTKAIHIETVSDLTTESFLAALRRFISRRGMVTDLYSDNATTFVGANNELNKLYIFLQEQQNELKSALTTEGIKWHFIPPRAPHFGGLWEAGIKSTKRILYKIAGGASLRNEEFVTLLIQIESILNSRPLCPLSNDPNDLAFLTPGHFLIGGNLRALPEPNLEDVKIGRLSRWQLVQRMQQHFWTRWQKEYLQEMQSRRKWKQSSGPSLQVGQFVLIHEDNIPPNRWRVGRVETVHPGKDGVVRAATVKTSNDSVVRPVVKLFAFPFDSDNDNPQEH